MLGFRGLRLKNHRQPAGDGLDAGGDTALHIRTRVALAIGIVAKLLLRDTRLAQKLLGTQST